MATFEKVFSLEGKGLKLDTGEDLEPHIAPLRAMDNVKEVRILGNSLGVGACKLLGEVLSTKKSLEVANLADIFTGRLLSEIPEALSSLLTSILNLPNLKTINLNDNAFGLNLQAPLVAFLSSHVPLQHLYLNNNGLGPDAGILIADALSELHAKKEAARKEGKEVPDLETVICGRNRLEDGSMAAWAKAFTKNNRVKEVKMVQNGIRPLGIEDLLSKGLSNASKLQVLDLQDNTFTASGAEALADATANWADIKELGVGDSLLEAKGGESLCKSLSLGKNKKLETLRLQGNEITARGIKKLAEAAENALPALKRVELNGNKFAKDDESIIFLQKLLQRRRGDLDGEEGEWGIDSLSDLEELDSDEEEEVEEEEELEPEERAEKLIKEAEEAQEEPVIQEKDKDVDALAKKLEKATI